MLWSQMFCSLVQWLGLPSWYMCRQLMSATRRRGRRRPWRGKLTFALASMSTTHASLQCMLTISNSSPMMEKTRSLARQVPNIRHARLLSKSPRLSTRMRVRRRPPPRPLLPATPSQPAQALLPRRVRLQQRPLLLAMNAIKAAMASAQLLQKNEASPRQSLGYHLPLLQRAPSATA